MKSATYRIIASWIDPACIATTPFPIISTSGSYMPVIVCWKLRGEDGA